MILLLTFSWTSNATTNISLDGVWKVKGASCESFKDGELVKINSALYKSGVTEETLEIKGNQATIRMKNWATDKKSYCTIMAEQKLEVFNSTFRVAEQKFFPVENKGRVCPMPEKNTVGQIHRFELINDQLKIYGARAAAEPSKNCTNGAVILTYLRIK